MGGLRDAAGGEGLGDPLGPGVVIGEARHVMIERVQARRRQDPGLAPRAADPMAGAIGLLDHSDRLPASTLPTGAPSPLLKQTLTVSKPAASAATVSPVEGCRVEEPGSVQVRAEAGLVRPGRALGQRGGAVGPATAAVVGVLERANRRARGALANAGAASGDQIGDRRQPVGRQGRHQLNPGERRGPRALPKRDVCALVQEHRVSRAGVRKDGQLVAHGAARHEERRVFAEPGQRLETAAD